MPPHPKIRTASNPIPNLVDYAISAGRGCIPTDLLFCNLFSKREEVSAGLAEAREAQSTSASADADGSWLDPDTVDRPMPACCSSRGCRRMRTSDSCMLSSRTPFPNRSPSIRFSAEKAGSSCNALRRVPSAPQSAHRRWPFSQLPQIQSGHRSSRLGSECQAIARLPAETTPELAMSPFGSGMSHNLN